MKKLKYGFFGEDEAHRIFLKNYLDQLVPFMGKSADITFVFDQEFARQFRGNDKAEVDARFAEAALKGFVKYKQNAFFIGRDLDTFQSEVLKSKVEAMKAALHPDFQEKTFLLIPVQCIEHWLWYLKFKKENPNSTKNENLDTKPNTEAKLALYGSARATNKHSNPIVENLSSLIDFEYLESRSESFRLFHKQVMSFIGKI